MKHTTSILLFFLLTGFFTSCDDVNSLSSGGDSTLQGSLNKFTVNGDYLYVINSTQLIPYNISSPNAPIKETAIEVGIGIETAITRGNTLFIGANDGMHIFDITDRANPKLLSFYRHVFGCDPVAVQGDYAYVTIRSTTACGNRFSANQLDVVNISDLSNPTTAYIYNMDTPQGLGAEGNHLFVAQGYNGLTNFSIEDPSKPNPTQRLTSIPHHADVIAVDNQYYQDLLIVTGINGIYQYDYSDGNLNLISQLSYQ